MKTKIESVYVCRISNKTDQLYVTTSDQERAIHSGLNLSQMNTCSLHFFCGLHAKWNVRDHTCSNGRMFGKRAATLWARNMQRAEGPQDFEKGYRKMLNEFSDDIPRTCLLYTSDAADD